MKTVWYQGTILQNKEDQMKTLLDYIYETLEKLEIRIQKLEEKERNSEIKEKQEALK